MLGPLTVGKKAAKFGYKKFGAPGAVIGGVGAAMGYRWLKKRTKRAAMDELAENPRGPSSATETGERVPGTDVGSDVGGTDVPVDERIGSVDGSGVDAEAEDEPPYGEDQSEPLDADADEPFDGDADDAGDA